MQISQYIYHYGLRAGLPFRVLQATAGLIDTAPRWPEVRRRRALAERLAESSRYAGFLPRDTACRAFSPGEIPALDRVCEIGRAVYARNTDYEEDRAAQGKSPISHLWRFVTDAEEAELVRLATADEIAEIMAGYFGAVPRFDNADIWVSRPNAAPIGSQLFHLDKPDRRYTSIFLNLEPVTDENGPFEFLDKQESDRVRAQTGYEKLYYLKDGRLPDAELDAIGATGRLRRLTGPEGAGGIVDTSECLHAGSRCRSGVRVVMILSYMHAHKPGQARFRRHADAMPAGDEVRRLMLGA